MPTTGLVSIIPTTVSENPAAEDFNSGVVADLKSMDVKMHAAQKFSSLRSEHKDRETRKQNSISRSHGHKRREFVVNRCVTNMCTSNSISLLCLRSGIDLPCVVTVPVVPSSKVLNFPTERLKVRSKHRRKCPSTRIIEGYFRTITLPGKGWVTSPSTWLWTADRVFSKRPELGAETRKSNHRVLARFFEDSCRLNKSLLVSDKP